MSFKNRLEKLKVKKYNTLIEFNHDIKKIEKIIDKNQVFKLMQGSNDKEFLMRLKKEAEIALNLITLYIANKESFILLKNVYEIKDKIDFKKPSNFIEHVTDQAKNLTNEQAGKFLISIVGVISNTGDISVESIIKDES